MFECSALMSNKLQSELVDLFFQTTHPGLYLYLMLQAPDIIDPCTF